MSIMVAELVSRSTAVQKGPAVSKWRSPPTIQGFLVLQASLFGLTGLSGLDERLNEQSSSKSFDRRGDGFQQ
jgi:hypothetical protein